MSAISEHKYIKAGLKIRSEFPLPELLQFDFDGHPDVAIRYGTAPKILPGGTQAMPEAQVTPGNVLLTIPGVARYHVISGGDIRVEPVPDAKPADIRLFLLGSAFGAIYLQRGDFPLHASAVVIDGKAVAYAGHSGIGKSTMAAWMSRQGYPMLCDDVCVIRMNQDQVPMAFPAYPRMKLWKDTLSYLDLETSGLQKHYARDDKFHASVRSMFTGSSVPLNRIVFPRFSEPAEKPSIVEISPSRLVPLLRANTYRFQFIRGLGLTESHFEQCVFIARGLSAVFLDRPRDLSSLAECQRLLEEHLA